MLRRSGLRRSHQLQRFLSRPAGGWRALPGSPTGLAVLVLLAAAAGFALGQWLHFSSGAAEAGLQAMKATYQAKLRNERELAAVKAREYAIIEEASNRLQVDNQELLASMSALEDRVAFFKRMASPQAARQRVDIEHFELIPGAGPDLVRYRLLITRNNPSGSLTQGSVRVRISGNGRQQDLTLNAPRFQFRYYQQFSGEWRVPAGFKPERVDIQARSDGVTVDRRYKWEIKNR